jgi:RND family efflux transporter MFP subunit
MAARPASGGAAAATGAVAAADVRQGRLSFVDSVVDAASGTVKVKAVFDNADQALWPGAYVNVKMALQTLPGAIVVPLATIVQGARGTAVFVAGPGNVAAMRPVKVLAQAGTEAVVAGLKPGERIVLDGRQNVRPGTLLVERAGEGGRAGSAPRGGAGAAQRASGASAS